MFQSVEELSQKLSETGYFIDPTTTKVVFLADQMKKPLLLLIAGADAATPKEAFVEFDHKLTEAKVPHEMHIYEGAPHSFFDRTFEQWKDACDDSWRRMLAFIKKHS